MPPLPEHTESGRDDLLANDVKEEPMNGSSQESESEDAQDKAESGAAARRRLQNAQFKAL